MARFLRLLSLALLLCVGLALAENPSLAPLTLSVSADDKQVQGSDSFVIPADSRNIRFDVDRYENGKREDAGRVRFKLQGYDENWGEYGVDMNLRVRFADDSGTSFPQVIYGVTGTSRGWDTDIAHSKFLHRRETILVSDGAKYLVIVISSAGPPTGIGVYAVRNLVLERIVPDGKIRKTFLGPFLNEGESFSENARVPGWVRDGTYAPMAKLFLTDPALAEYGFCLVDDNTSCHAEWRMDGKGIEITKPEPGEKFVLEWNETYSIGYGQRSRADYRRLPPGHYQFRVNKLDFMGNPLAYEKSIDLTVSQTFWKRPLPWVVIINVVILLILFWIRRASQRKVQLQLERLRQEHMLESERLRIARNIHDDLGARLTQVILASEMASSESQSLSDAKAELKEVSNMSRELVAALRETVWAVDPKNDSLQALIDFLCENAQKLCDAANIRCNLRICEIVKDIEVSSETRHHISLAVKEAVHNAVKYSGSPAITLEVRQQGNLLVVLVLDQGVAFSVKGADGHGLENMRFRTEAVGGRFHIQSEEGKGTTVSFEIPFTG